MYEREGGRLLVVWGWYEVGGLIRRQVLVCDLEGMTLRRILYLVQEYLWPCKLGQNVLHEKMMLTLHLGRADYVLFTTRKW